MKMIKLTVFLIVLKLKIGREGEINKKPTRVVWVIK